MHEKSYSSLIKNLCEKHYNYEIDFDHYRAQRKKLFDEIDATYNGVFAHTDTKCSIRSRSDLSLENTVDDATSSPSYEDLSDDDTVTMDKKL